jgi:hypothetical protein
MIFYLFVMTGNSLHYSYVGCYYFRLIWYWCLEVGSSPSFRWLGVFMLTYFLNVILESSGRSGIRCSILWIASLYINHQSGPEVVVIILLLVLLNIFISFLIEHTEKHMEHTSSFGWWNHIICCSTAYVFMDISTFSHCIHWPSFCACWAVMNESGAPRFMFSDFNSEWPFCLTFVISRHVHGGCWMCNCLIFWIKIYGLIFVSKLIGIFHDFNSVVKLNLFVIDIVNLSLLPHGYMVLPLFLLWFSG